jgi:hypothetical protein
MLRQYYACNQRVISAFGCIKDYIKAWILQECEECMTIRSFERCMAYFNTPPPFGPTCHQGENDSCVMLISWPLHQNVFR